jgi:hypothetical protein
MDYEMAKTAENTARSMSKKLYGTESMWELFLPTVYDEIRKKLVTPNIKGENNES